ncbi:hypothetical protein ACFFX1_00760 [Dactylosporangium sucinum]|nr:hypothetical protein [Dactylosporangium sucinum]
MRRRVTAYVLIGSVAVAVPLAGAAAVNPWRYVYLLELGRTPVVVAVLTVAPVLVAVAVGLLTRDRAARIAVGWVAAGLSIVTVCAGGYLSTARSVYGGEPEAGSEIVAVSPDGRFELAVRHYPVFMRELDVYRLRSRAGLLSRESRDDVACFAFPFDPLGPADTFASARFPDNATVEIRTEANVSWTTGFDPHSLAVPARLSHGCGRGA